ncbi:hypothetical protein HPB48_017430 [Haemaphysalis longicornis]|uniref:Uncharacterized protein n=1 Tax=Haemaphysalis longicornis TaxID=44386 RepID=A0A9J6GBE7_HAELO|nr:hypothetical protein HPB48_017430 [Haemaphysalis longicornis]
MSSVARLEAFDASTSEWPEYHERVLLYFAANDVAEDKRKAVFLTSCSAATYSLLRNLLSPTKPGEATLAVIFAALGTHFKPKVHKRGTRRGFGYCRRCLCRHPSSGRQCHSI